jgi:hypothetical protein
MPTLLNTQLNISTDTLATASDDLRAFRFDQLAWWETLQSDLLFTATTSTGIVAGTVTYVPFLVKKPIVITDLSIRQVGAGSAGSVFVIGIYKASATSYPAPGQVVYNSAPISATVANSDKEITGLSLSLPKGLYYLAINTNSTTAITFLGIPESSVLPYILYTPVTNSTRAVSRITNTAVYSPIFTPNPSGLNWSNSTGFTAPLFRVKLQKSIPA